MNIIFVGVIWETPDNEGDLLPNNVQDALKAQWPHFNFKVVDMRKIFNEAFQEAFISARENMSALYYHLQKNMFMTPPEPLKGKEN